MKKLTGTGEIAALTGVRGLAAVWVVLFHAYPSVANVLSLPDRQSIPFISIGFLGVDLFFILSGFIMAYVHGADFEKYRWQEHKRFLMLRACRVYPIHIVCLVVFATVLLSLSGSPDHLEKSNLTSVTFIETVLLVQNWGLSLFSGWNSPTWSLSAEILGYIAFPFITLAIKRYVRPGMEAYVIVAILSVFLLILFATGHSTVDSIGKTGVCRMLSEFTAGCLIHRALSTVGTRFHPESIFWSAVAALILATSSIRLNFLAPFGLTLLIAALAMPCRAATLVFANPMSIWLGKVSFSLYLSHMAILLIYDRYFLDSPIPLTKIVQCMIIVGVALSTLVISYGLWKLVEMPSRRYLRHYIPKSASKIPSSLPDPV